jgi:hypothetical protein
MRYLIPCILAVCLLSPGCTCRHRVGPEGSTGNGGILRPDSTTRFDTSKKYTDTAGQLHDTIATPDTTRTARGRH